MALKRPLAVLGQSSITINGQVIPYTVKRSPRIKHVRIEFRIHSGITVVIPRVFDVAQISRVLNNHKKWILSKLDGSKKIQSHALENGDTVPYMGKELKLLVLNHQQSYFARLENGSLIVGTKSSENNMIPAILELWFRQQCLQIVTRKAIEISHKLGVNYRRLVVRGQRTRWGSCSRLGNLNFNWKLALTPEPVIDYVVTHELAHLKELNHSRKFWELVEHHCPDYRQHRKWLKEHELQINACWA